MPDPRDGKFGKMPHYCPGGGRALLELTDDTRYFTLSYFLHNRGNEFDRYLPSANLRESNFRQVQPDRLTLVN